MNRTITSVLALAALTLSLAGCAGLDRTAAEADPIHDIAWLSNRLAEDGLFVRSRGNVTFQLLARDSSRLILDGQTVVEAFYFDSRDDAAKEAARLASLHPHLDVYLSEQLVAVRATDREGVAREQLVSILGAAL